MVARTSLWLMACGIMLLCVAVPHASTHPTPDASPQGVQPYYPQQQPQHYYPSYDEEEIVEEDEDSGKINLQDFEPVLAESGSTGRTARKMNRYLIPRGSRFKKGNPKMVKRNKEVLERHNAIFNKRIISFITDDIDPKLELPEPSSTPWMQLAMLGTYIWGMNVALTQMILDVTEPAWVPAPFGLNRKRRDEVDGSGRLGSGGLDFTEAPTKFLNADGTDMSHFVELPDILKRQDVNDTEAELDVTGETNTTDPSVVNRSARAVRDHFPAKEESLDFFEDYNTLEIPSEVHCREQMVCEVRHLMTYVTPLEHIIRTYGMRVPGLRQGYQKALDDGSSRRSCKTHQKEECPNSIFTVLLSIVKAITGERY